MAITTRRRREQSYRYAGMELLRSLLSPAQIADLDATCEYTEKGRSGHSYRIALPQAGIGPVSVISDYNAWLCIHATDRYLPSADQAITFLLVIRADEPGFRRTCNEYRTWTGRP